MLGIIDKSDFVGKYNLAKNAYDSIQAYIDKYDEVYLRSLLGVELYKLFIADLLLIPTTPATPSTPIYTAIFDPFAEDEAQNCCFDFYFQYEYCAPQNGQIRNSNGIKEMLLGFIWWEIARTTKFKQTPAGGVVSQSENSREAGFLEMNIADNYNEAIRTYQTIQWYVFKNKTTDYPLFNGIRKRLINPILG